MTTKLLIFLFWFTAFGNAKTRINDNSSRFVSIIGIIYTISNSWSEMYLVQKTFNISFLDIYQSTKIYSIFRGNIWRYRLTLKVILSAASYQIVSNFSAIVILISGLFLHMNSTLLEARVTFRNKCFIQNKNTT